MSKEWFVYSKNSISGPYSTEQVQTDANDGRWTNECFVWSKGQREWMPLTHWRSQLGVILQHEENQTAPVWYVDVESTPVGPLTRAEMLAQIQKLTNINKVRVWTVGFAHWTNIFDLSDIMDELGLSRREHVRAPVMGTVAIKHAGSDQITIARAASISTAGMGINGASFLTKGENIQFVVRCNELNPLHLNGAVAYITPHGYAGIRFDHASPETQSIISDYVKRFQAPLRKVA